MAAGYIKPIEYVSIITGWQHC